MLANVRRGLSPDCEHFWGRLVTRKWEGGMRWQGRGREEAGEKEGEARGRVSRRGTGKLCIVIPFYRYENRLREVQLLV